MLGIVIAVILLALLITVVFLSIDRSTDEDRWKRMRKWGDDLQKERKQYKNNIPQ